MPGNLAFPGGKLEPADEPARERALARCASREMEEETGLPIAPSRWIDAGVRTTPPIFAVRFRTRFFVTEIPPDAVVPTAPPDAGEIESIELVDPRRVLADWESGAALVPPPLLPILRLLRDDSTGNVAIVATKIAEINGAEDPSPRIEFVPGIWVVPQATRTLPPASCTNVWMPGGRAFLVLDPGSADSAENERLLAVVARRVAWGDRVAAVLLTHHHRDHVSGAATVADALGAPVWAHAETFARVPKFAPPIVTRTLADGERIDLDGMTLDVLHTPGHAPGHLALFDSARRVLLAGDLVSGLSTILVGDGPGDMDDYLASLRRVAALRPTVVLPSHGPPLPGEAPHTTAAHREEREAKVLAALDGTAPQSLAAVAEAAYADSPSAPTFLRELQARSHLARLMRRGIVELSGGGYRRIAV
jgi:glyoxylase-like metal-dependent hydrolase (beta-lactamase superfamily II)/8-oxo-dGTP pyrophosphatase MutT (NUDIX family)